MFDLDLHSPLTDEQRDAMIDSMAEMIIGKRLETPAVLFLDMHKPLSWITGQSLLVGAPLLGLAVGVQNVVDFGKLLMERDNIDTRIDRIEEMSANADKAQEQA